MDILAKRMLAVFDREEPQVFQVNLFKNDHRTTWTAMATLRGSDGQTYSVENTDPIMAVILLDGVLDSLVCPHCGALKKDKDEYES